MIYKDIKLFSQNVWKNSLIIKTILEIKTNFDIIFIQEPSWTTIHSIFSSTNCKRESLVDIVNHPNWLIFTRPYTNESECPRVIYLVSFFNNGNIFWLVNMYSDSSHSVLKYLKDTEVNICNFLVITGDFNIWDNL